MKNYFTIEELCKTNHKVENVPNDEVISNLQYLIDLILNPAREELGEPITVNSGYRCTKLNKLVGGSNTSDHMFGYSADITCNNNKKLFDILAKQNKFDQLIYYTRNNYPNIIWIHVSTRRDYNRHEILHSPSNGKYIKIK